jgi:hypothetical protein
VYDLNKFIEWVLEKPTRNLELKISKGGESVAAWVSDSSLGAGSIQYVKSVEEINLEAEVEKWERPLYERLKAKFEPKQEPPLQPTADDEAAEALMQNNANRENVVEPEVKDERIAS